MHHNLVIRSPFKECLGCLQHWAIMNISNINNSVQMFYGYKFSIKVSKYLGIQILNYMVSQFSFVEKYQSILPSGYKCSVPQQWLRISVAAHPFQQMILSVFQILAILIGVWQCHNVVLINNYLVTYDVNHHFICLFAIYSTSLVRCLFKTYFYSVKPLY